MERVGGNPIGSLHHNRNPVHHEPGIEGLGGFVIFEFHRPQANARRGLEERLFVRKYPDCGIIHVGFAVAGRPPQLGIVNVKIDDAASEILVPAILEHRVAALHFNFNLEHIPAAKGGGERIGKVDPGISGTRVFHHVEIA